VPAATTISVSAAAIMIALLLYRAIHIERGGSADLSAGLGRLGETASVGRRDRRAGFATSAKPNTRGSVAAPPAEVVD
jgi:hypothetical protein